MVEFVAGCLTALLGITLYELVITSIEKAKKKKAKKEEDDK